MNHSEEDSIRIHPPNQQYVHIYCGPGPSPFLPCLVFAKCSLLEQHEILLGHRDTFSWDICQKTFSRKDNLAAHRKKHYNKEYYHCGICNRLFSHQDILELHKNTRRGKIGRRIKRKAIENHGPPVKGYKIR